MPVSLSDADRRRALDAVVAWFRDERGEDVGALQAGFLLDAVLKELGPAVYAAAIADAQAHLARVVEDLPANVVPDPRRG